MSISIQKFTLLLTLSICLIASFSFKDDTSIIPPAQSTKHFYTIAFQRFLTETKKLEQAVEMYYQQQTTAKKVKSTFVSCRNEFKKFEFLLTYIDSEGVKKHINGAPLPSLEANVPEVHVIAPSGLQRIDEILFSTPSEWQKNELSQLTKKLHIKAKELYVSQQKHLSLYDRNVYEAARLGLIRIFTLGVTGFDTPASDNAIPEAQIGVENIYKVLKPYLPQIREKNPSLAKDITTTFEASLTWLEHNHDFDSFDRLTFIKNYINPMYASLLEAQTTMGVETIYETTNRKLSLNYLSKNLFAPDHLNAYYYTKLTAKNDSKEKRELGKLLFFDPILSQNNKRSCASCHNPKKGFTDGQAKSLAFDFNGSVDRNAPTIINSAYATRFFHDMRSNHLDSQIEHVIFNEKEFNTDYKEIIDKLSQSDEYMTLFQEAFPSNSSPIYKANIAEAIASYILSLKSFNSPFDQYVRGESDHLSIEAQRGFNLFMGKAACGTCHFAPVFNGNVPPYYQDTESEILGVTETEDFDNPVLDPDLGRYNNQLPKDHANYMKFAFKTPTIRNIELTAPYMHNGAYSTLEKVMDFYNKGGGAGMGIDLPNQTLPFDSLALKQHEINDIIAFMKSLTDTTGITSIPEKLPQFKNQSLWNTRQIGGEY